MNYFPPAFHFSHEHPKKREILKINNPPPHPSISVPPSRTQDHPTTLGRIQKLLSGGIQTLIQETQYNFSYSQ